MKKHVLLGFLLILIFVVTDAQTSLPDFKIGILSNGGYTKTSDGRIDPDGDGVYKVLSKDGFNIVRTYEPSVDGWTKQDFKNMITQIGKNNLKLMMYNEFFFKITDTINHMGRNQYNFIVGDGNNYVTAYVDAFKEVYSNDLYKNIIWGYDITGESNDTLHPYPIYNTNPPTFGKMRIPYQNVDSAFIYFRTLKDSLNIADHKLLNCPGPHNHLMLENGEYDQYLRIPNKGDVCYDAGYFYGTFKHFNDTGILAQHRDQILKKYYNLDFYRSKKNFNEVHTEVNFADMSFSNYDDKFQNSSNLSPTRKNYNFKWFEAYNAIIYGVNGVWFYSLGDAFVNEGKDMGILAKSGITKGKFPHSYRKYLSNLSKELRFLKEKGFLDSKPISTKKDTALSNDILDPCSHYQPLTLDYTNARDLFDYWMDTTDTNIPFETITNLVSNENVGNEKFGVHYTVRTNGNEVILILTNPSPIVLFNVKIHIDNLSNPILQQSTDADVLFESARQPDVTARYYKTDRYSGVNWKNKTVRKKYSIDIDSQRIITLNFGPYDTHVLLFSAKK